MNFKKIALAAGVAALASAASAQSGVTVYGTYDQYLNVMRSSSGAQITSLEDGSTLRTRLGFRGEEDLGNGYKAKFNLEMGIAGDSGAPADTTRAMDRQSWVGLATPVGEFRMGRQNTAIFYRGDYIDFSSRTLGSVVNAFGAPSRYDNDFSWISNRMNGFLLEAHYALAETTAGFGAQAIYQTAVDYNNGPFRVGYAGIAGKAPPNAAVSQGMRYDNLYANYDFGKGKVYAAYIRSNNNAASGTLNNGGSILGNVGGLVAGTNAEANRFYNISSLSADYQATAQLRVGALYGRINDTSGGGKNANGFGVGAYYALSKRTTLLALANTIRNSANAGFRPAGSAGLRAAFTDPADVNGKNISGVQVGIVHRF